MIATRVGEYELVERLGSGSTATVARATRSSDGRTVAVKLMHAQLGRDPEYRERFAREARIASQAEHPNLVRVIDHGESGDTLYLVSAYMTGGSMRARRVAGPVEQVMTLGRELAMGLGYLHECGIVHRDVKPSNIMFDGEGRLRLTDFGLAKHLASVALTRTGLVVGTPAYMAPEVVQGAPATPASDMYAAGCTLFEALTGRPPFVAGSFIQVAVEQVCTPPPDPRSLRDGVPSVLADALLRGLAKEPAERPTAEELLRALSA